MTLCMDTYLFLNFRKVILEMELWWRHAEEIAKLVMLRMARNTCFNFLAGIIQYESQHSQRTINFCRWVLAKQNDSRLKQEARKCKILEALEAKNWKEVFTMLTLSPKDDKL